MKQLRAHIPDPVRPAPDVFQRGVADMITPAQIETLFISGRRVRVKHGIDLTGSLHVGHAVNLWKIRALQDAGHCAVIILGAFTTMIGDPTGRSKTRPQLDRAAIAVNLRRIRRQLGRILRTERELFEVRLNSEWFGKMRAAEFLHLASLVTHARLLERDMFQERIAKGEEIAMSEFLYPLLQGYDSVAIASDLTVIGSDQLFNEHMGRFFQERFGQPPQAIVAHRILPGPDGGAKMSKSSGNAIGIDDPADEQFGKAMRVIDNLIVPYAELYTDMPDDRVHALKADLANGRNPMDVKLEFAEALVRRYYGTTRARRERERFVSVFSRKATDDLPVVALSYGSRSVLELVQELGFAQSNSEARRLIRQGAVDIDGALVTDEHADCAVRSGTTIRVGKRRLARIQ